MAEWFNAAVLKTAEGKLSVSSNLTPSVSERAPYTVNVSMFAFFHGGGAIDAALANRAALGEFPPPQKKEAESSILASAAM